MGLKMEAACADNQVYEKGVLTSSMQIPPTFSAVPGTPAAAAFGLLGRLAKAVLPPLPVAAAPPDAAAMTPARVRLALLEMGVGAADAEVALAAALVQAGLPLTAPSLAEAHADLARAPGASPEAYVLAKSLALPASPDTLRALTAVLEAPGKTPAPGALPEPVRLWLGLGLDAAVAPEAQARHLREMLRQVGRSTEHRLLAAQKDESPLPVADLRTALLRLAGASGDPALRTEAGRLASLVEGQQLLNSAAQAHNGAGQAGRPDLPLYFAVPLVFDGLPTLAETCLWPPPEEAQEPGRDAEEPGLRVVVRVAPPRLGRVQIDLSGKLAGSLRCCLGAERPAAVRLLSRHTGLLAEALSAAGWTSCEVACRPQADWPPLWPGGAAKGPRQAVDRHV